MTRIAARILGVTFAGLLSTQVMAAVTLTEFGTYVFAGAGTGLTSDLIFQEQGAKGTLASFAQSLHPDASHSATAQVTIPPGGVAGIPSIGAESVAPLAGDSAGAGGLVIQALEYIDVAPTALTITLDLDGSLAGSASVFAGGFLFKSNPGLGLTFPGLDDEIFSFDGVTDLTLSIALSDLAKGSVLGLTALSISPGEIPTDVVAFASNTDPGALAIPINPPRTMSIDLVQGDQFYVGGVLLTQGADDGTAGFLTTLNLTYDPSGLVAASAVPVPPAIWLLGSGLALFVGWRRRHA